MKKICKYLALNLVALTVASMVACETMNNGGQTGNANKNAKDYMSYNVVGNIEGTTHERNVSTTSYKLLDNGVSSYKIVTTEEIGNEMKKAVSEFNTFFQ